MWAVMASPLLISANIRNMSAMNLETYKNKEVIDVSQDSLAQQGIRVVGGPLGGSSGGGKSAHTNKCVTGSKTQQWEFGTGAQDEFVLSLSHAGLQLNSDDCHADLIWYETGGRIPANDTGTCCGKVGANNLRFRKDWPSKKGQLGMEPCGESLPAVPSRVLLGLIRICRSFLLNCGGQGQ